MEPTLQIALDVSLALIAYHALVVLSFATRMLSLAVEGNEQPAPPMLTTLSLESLPHELLLAIFDHLDFRSCCALLLCCKKTRQSLLDPSSMYSRRIKRLRSIKIQCFSGGSYLEYSVDLMKQIRRLPDGCRYFRFLFAEYLLARPDPQTQPQDDSFQGTLLNTDFDFEYPPEELQFYIKLLRTTYESYSDEWLSVWRARNTVYLSKWLPSLLFPGLKTVSVDKKDENSFRCLLTEWVVPGFRRTCDSSYRKLADEHPSPIHYPYRKPVMPFGYLTTLNIVAIAGDRNSFDSLTWLLRFAELPSLKHIFVKTEFPNDSPQDWWLPKVWLQKAIVLDKPFKGCPHTVKFVQHDSNRSMIEYNYPLDNSTQAVNSLPLTYCQAKEKLLRTNFKSWAPSPNPQSFGNSFHVRSGMIQCLHVTGYFKKVNLGLHFEPRRLRSKNARVSLTHCVVLVGCNSEVKNDGDREMDVTLKFAQ